MESTFCYTAALSITVVITSGKQVQYENPLWNMQVYLLNTKHFFKQY